jgi:hypothetical protein
MQGREFGHELGEVSVAGQSVEHDPPGDGRVLGRGQLPGRHTQTVRHNCHARQHSRAARPGGLSWPVGVAPVRDRQDRDDPRPVINGIQSTVIAAPGGQDFLERRV